jgi:hypothetical protein
MTTRTRVHATVVVLLPVHQDVAGDVAAEGARAVAALDAAGLGGVRDGLRGYLTALVGAAAAGAPAATFGLAQAQFVPGDVADVTRLLGHLGDVAALLHALAAGDAAAARAALAALVGGLVAPPCPPPAE